MTNPYLIRLLWVLVILFIPTLVAMMVIDSGLKTSASPMGIVSFEFCGITSTCEQALSQWGPQGQQLAMLSLGVDYLFMVLYPSIICIALLTIAAKIPVRFNNTTQYIAWTTLLAGVFDAFENYFLVRIMLSGTGETWGLLASTCASAKFFILGIALIWLLCGLMMLQFRRKN